MIDLSPEILTRLRAARLPNGQALPFSPGEDFLFPAYAGLSILNLPASICTLLGAPPLGGPLLDDTLLAALGGPYRRVILVVLDALAFHRFKRWVDASAPDSAWHTLTERGLFAPLTSVVPSTTTAALTSLWTGRSPAEHGIPGFELWLKEYGVVVNMIQHRPINFRGGSSDSLERAGFKPEDVLPFPTMGQHLKEQGVVTVSYHHRSIVQSTLSRMLLSDVDSGSYFSAADLWVNLRRRIEARPDERMYAWVYWDALDNLGHYYGPDDERCHAELTAFGDGLQRLFVDRLPATLRADTLLLLTADHGQVTAPPDDYNLLSYPGLTRRLHLRPTGESRLAYLYIRPGQTEAVREYIQRTWPNQFALIDSAYAIDAGLFGPGTPHPALLDRVGDIVAVAKGAAYWWWSGKKNDLVGRHGGLHPDEMLVPLLALPLG
jgi:predicted AlkP superfamily pyrophosphatase or phosphodiesterase